MRRKNKSGPTYKKVREEYSKILEKNLNKSLLDSDSEENTDLEKTINILKDIFANTILQNAMFKIILWRDDSDDVSYEIVKGKNIAKTLEKYKSYRFSFTLADDN